MAYENDIEKKISNYISRYDELYKKYITSKIDERITIQSNIKLLLEEIKSYFAYDKERKEYIIKYLLNNALPISLLEIILDRNDNKNFTFSKFSSEMLNVIFGIKIDDDSIEQIIADKDLTLVFYRTKIGEEKFLLLPTNDKQKCENILKKIFNEINCEDKKWVVMKSVFHAGTSYLSTCNKTSINFQDDKSTDIVFLPVLLNKAFINNDLRNGGKTFCNNIIIPFVKKCNIAHKNVSYKVESYCKATNYTCNSLSELANNDIEIENLVYTMRNIPIQMGFNISNGFGLFPTIKEEAENISNVIMNDKIKNKIIILCAPDNKIDPLHWDSCVTEIGRLTIDKSLEKISLMNKEEKIKKLCQIANSICVKIPKKIENVAMEATDICWLFSVMPLTKKEYIDKIEKNFNDSDIGGYIPKDNDKFKSLYDTEQKIFETSYKQLQDFMKKNNISDDDIEKFKEAEKKKDKLLHVDNGVSEVSLNSKIQQKKI